MILLDLYPLIYLIIYININLILSELCPLIPLINCINIKGDTIGLYIHNIYLYNPALYEYQI